MNYRTVNMKWLVFFLFSTAAYGQSYLDYNKFEDKVLSKSAFGDDQTSIIVIEFWAAFNDANAFQGAEQLKNISAYYRIDISKYPESKKDYRVRMTPTIIVFKDGEEQEKFKAGLDLLCPVTLDELQETIDDAKNASKF